MGHESSDLESTDVDLVLRSHSVKKIKLGRKKKPIRITDKSHTNRLDIKYHKISSKIAAYKNISQLSVKNSFNENDENIEKKIFANAERKVFNNNRSSIYPRNADLFILDNPKKYFNIHENVTINNLLHNNLIGEISYKMGGGFHKKFIAIKSNSLIVYSYIKRIEEQSKYDILCEKNEDYFYRAESVINLKESIIYLSRYKNISLLSFFYNMLSRTTFEDRVNITNKQIIQILRNKNIFTIKLKEKSEKSEFDTVLLEIEIFFQKQYFTFRPKNISDFLRWTFAIYGRGK